MGIITVASTGDTKLAPPLIEVNKTVKLSLNSGVSSSLILILNAASVTPSDIVSVPCRELILRSLEEAEESEIDHDTVT